MTQASLKKRSYDLEIQLLAYVILCFYLVRDVGVQVRSPVLITRARLIVKEKTNI
jgi:hypothetical protein